MAFTDENAACPNSVKIFSRPNFQQALWFDENTIWICCMKFCCPIAWSSEPAVFKRLRAGWVKETNQPIKQKNPNLVSLHFLTHLFLKARPFRHFLPKLRNVFFLFSFKIPCWVCFSFSWNIVWIAYQGNLFKSELFPHKTHSQTIT